MIEMMNKKTLLLFSGLASLVISTAAIVPALTATTVAQPANTQSPNRGMGRLNLTADQQTKIKQIREASRQQIQSILTPQQQAQIQQARQQKQRPQLNLTEEQKAQLKALNQNTRRQIDEVLTPEQRQQLQQQHGKRHHNRSQTMQNQETSQPQ